VPTATRWLRTGRRSRDHRLSRASVPTNRFRLADLQAGMTYYYRLFVTHAEGKSWDYHSGRFTTK
jgi:hypothetical protein